ncbi:MAG: N-acetyl sugar amidotransferase [Bdellovibrionaceae bacterium]|nr:N-acetyl sugar amidotransferase [Pseudobdellovibrionaceae bacterium]
MSSADFPSVVSPHAHSYQVCVHCAMDTTDEAIRFDSNGRCYHCLHYEVRAEREIHRGESGRRYLEQVAEVVRRDGRNRPYDCIVGVSGGVDSTYVAYLTKQLGLRPLAVHFDNGWNSETAVMNIKNALNRLNIDLHTHVMEWEEFRDIQRAFFLSSVPNMEMPTDHAIHAVLFEMAGKTGARYIFSGSNLQTEGILPRSWVYDHRDFRFIRAVHRRFGERPMRNFPHYTLPGLAKSIFIDRVRFVRPLNATDFNKEAAKELLQSELGWRDYGGKHWESIYTRFFQGYILPKKFNMDKRRPHLSTLIASGQISREKALDELRRPPYPTEMIEADIEFFCKKLKISRETFDRVMSEPARSYEEFPRWGFLSGGPFQFAAAGLKRFVRKI